MTDKLDNAAESPGTEKTRVASPPPSTRGRQTRGIWIGLGGCGLLLCLGLLVIGGYFTYNLLQDRGAPLLAAATETSTVTLDATDTPAAPTPTATPPPPSATPTQAIAAAEPSDTPPAEDGQQQETGEPTSTPRSLTRPTATPTVQQVAVPPSIEELVFAAASPDSADLPEPTTTFPAETTEVHAIFSYSGLMPDQEWTRVWYVNGEEFATFSDPWDSDEEGVFDYWISSESGGQPLDPGQWTLEMFFDGELLASGEFTIEEPAPVVTRNFALAYAVWDGGKHNLFIANVDGSGRQFVLERAAGPSWSSDGRSLYVYGEEGVDRQIRDGTEYTWPEAGISNGVLLLYDVPGPGGGIPDAFQDPGWKDGSARATNLAPNGQMLAFDAARGGPDRRIYFLGTADNQQSRFEIPGEQPDWSPDSAQVIYRSCRGNKCGIWLSNRDDSGARNITQNGGDAFPRWSPDGRFIAFSRDVGGNHDIFVMNADGSRLRQLTDSPAHDTLPAWTPDSQRIVFRSARSGSWGIYVMNADGSDQTLIIPEGTLGPDWSFGKMDLY